MVLLRKNFLVYCLILSGIKECTKKCVAMYIKLRMCQRKETKRAENS